MNSFALLSHGGVHLLKDATTLRGHRNDEYWQTFLSGHRPPPPRVPYVHQKFVALLKGAGVNVVREGRQQHLMALTDRDVAELAGDRELRNAETVHWKDGLRPVPGGLFDPTLTGGHSGGRWAKVTLHEPLPNPAFEEPIRRLLGLTGPRFEAILAGRERLHGATGPAAVRKALAAIHLPRAVEQARAEIAGGKLGARDAAVRRLGYLKAAERLGVHPKDWVLSAVPVLPPAFRPVSLMKEGGGQLVADPNYLYKELFDANQTLKQLHGRVADTGDERLALYNALRGVVGLGDPVHPKNKERGVRGLLRTVFGDGPKHSYTQSKLLSSSVNLVGRAVVSPDPDLDLDQVGLPEGRAWAVYKPFVVRRLVRNGTPPLEAVRAADDRTPRARDALLAEMAARPVLVDRAPVLHRYGVMAFWPKLVKGHTMKLTPFVTKGYSADFDGNCLVFGSKVALTVDWARVYRTLSGKDLAAWEDFHMRLVGDSKIVLQQDGTEGAYCVEIGAMPRTGTPRTDARGSEVYDVPPGVRVLSYDHATARACFSDVTGYTVDKGHACARAVTRRGRSVTVSDNASLAVYDPAGDGLVKVRPADAVGRLVPFVRRQGAGGTAYTFDHGWWYAALAADGWVAVNNVVGYAKNDDVKRARFVELAHDLFPGLVAGCNEYRDRACDRPGKFADSVKVHLHGRGLADAVCRLPVYADRGPGRGALYKRLPADMLDRGSEDCLLGLLSGLLDGDAWVGWNAYKKRPQFGARVNTSSAAMRDDVCRLGRLLGLRVTVTTVPAAANRSESYVLSFCLADLHRLAPRLRLVGSAAAGLLAGFAAAAAPADPTDVVPVPHAAGTTAAKALLAERRMTLYSAVRRGLACGYMTRQQARAVLDLVDAARTPAYAAWRATAGNEDVHWDVFETVEAAEAQDVFDLVVPETKVFATDDGLVVYDTMNYHVPADDRAVEEAVDKLLPSRNLFSVARFKADTYLPNQEYVGGLYLATADRPSGRRARVFATRRDAVGAYRRGELDVNDPVEIIDERGELGRDKGR